VTLSESAGEGWQFKEHITMFSEDTEAYNNYEHPDTILPVSVPDTTCAEGQVQAMLKPLSWNMFRFVKEM